MLRIDVQRENRGPTDRSMSGRVIPWVVLALVGCSSQPISPEQAAAYRAFLARSAASNAQTFRPLDAHAYPEPVAGGTVLPTFIPAQTSARFVSSPPDPAPSFASARKLMLFGGQNRDVYLGCLSCDEVVADSIWNEVGRFGSEVSSTSIWNEVGQYGSEVSDLSPWNELARHPPVIVDQDGRFYGYFTTNEVMPGRTRSEAALRILAIGRRR